MNDLKTYLLRGIPADLWRKFQAKCKLKGTSAKEVILKAIAVLETPRGPSAMTHIRQNAQGMCGREA